MEILVIPSEVEESRPFTRWRSLDLARDDILVLLAYLQGMTLARRYKVDVMKMSFETLANPGTAVENERCIAALRLDGRVAGQP